MFETETPWPGGGKAWSVEVFFGFEPDHEGLRDLVAAAAGDEAASLVEFGVTSQQDWVANSLAGLAPVRAGRFLVHGAHDRGKVRANDIAIQIEAGLAFGTGHHGTTRGCLLHLDRLLKRRRPQRVLDVGCGAGVLAIAAAKALKRRVWLGDIDPVAVQVANENIRLNGVAEFARALVSRGVENRFLREGLPYDTVFANILAKPLRPARALVEFGDRRKRVGDPVGASVERCRGRARGVASARILPRRAHRSGGLVELEAGTLTLLQEHLPIPLHACNQMVMNRPDAPEPSVVFMRDNPIAARRLSVRQDANEV